jgi:hypothetical protein
MPLGPEFRVNTYTSFDQIPNEVARDPSGNFVVVWQSEQDGSGSGIFGQRYLSSGVPQGPEFRVNTQTVGSQYDASVGSDASGNFVVVWTSPDGFQYGISGQRYSASGAPLGPEFRVNTYTSYYQERPSVAVDPSGNFVVAWSSTNQDFGTPGVFGQRYSSSGAPLGSEFRVNSYTTSGQTNAAVASDAAGNFVVVWQSDDQQGPGSNSRIYGQRYASTGTPLGSEFRISGYTTSYQFSQKIAVDSAGGFVVVWGQRDDGASFADVFGQRYDASGAALGAEFRVNTYTTNEQVTPWVASDLSGNFVVAWMSYTQDVEGGVFGQRYASSGAVLGAEFRVNTYMTGPQWFPTVATDPSGEFVVIWGSRLQDGGAWGVYGQRYGQIVPVELMRFTVE